MAIICLQDLFKNRHGIFLPRRQEGGITSPLGATFTGTLGWQVLSGDVLEHRSTPGSCPRWQLFSWIFRGIGMSWNWD